MFSTNPTTANENYQLSLRSSAASRTRPHQNRQNPRATFSLHQFSAKILRVGGAPYDPSRVASDPTNLSFLRIQPTLLRTPPSKHISKMVSCPYTPLFAFHHSTMGGRNCFPAPRGWTAGRVCSIRNIGARRQNKFAMKIHDYHSDHQSTRSICNDSTGEGSMANSSDFGRHLRR